MPFTAESGAFLDRNRHVSAILWNYFTNGRHLRSKSSSDTANSDGTEMPAFHCMSAGKLAFSSDSVNSGKAELDTLNDGMSMLS